MFAVSTRFVIFGRVRAIGGMDLETSVVFVHIAALALPLALRQATRVRR